MEFKLEGPGTVNFMQRLNVLLEAGTEALQAYAQRMVQEMKMTDKLAAGNLQLQELNKRRQKLENEVRQWDRQLEDRKKKATGAQQSAAKPQEKPAEGLKGGTKPLTPDEQAAHRAKVDEERRIEKEAKEAKEPMTHRPFAALASMEAAQQSQGT